MIEQLDDWRETIGHLGRVARPGSNAWRRASCASRHACCGCWPNCGPCPRSVRSASARCARSWPSGCACSRWSRRRDASGGSLSAHPTRPAAARSAWCSCPAWPSGSFRRNCARTRCCSTRRGTLLDQALPRRDKRASDERLQLQLALGAATERLYLSYPRLDVNESRPRVPSFYALDVRRALTGRIPSHEDLQQEAYDAGAARLAWPAPAEPLRAIDALEHDLAILRPLFDEQGRASVAGRARYLLELNPCLSRSVRERWARHQTQWSDADGLLRGLRPDCRSAGVAAARATAVLAVGAAALRGLSVPVPSLGGLSPRAARGRGAAAAPGPAHEGQPVPSRPERVAPHAARSRAGCRCAPTASTRR